MNSMIRRIALGCVLMLTLTPLGAGAENTDPGDGMVMQMRSQMGRYNVDRSQLDDQQKQVYDKALSDYAAIEDQALAALVAAGDVTQQDVDSFTRMRATQGAMASMETDKWTDDQQQAFQSAMAAQGDDRASAFAALVSSGQLTQAQADAFSAMSTFMGRRADAGDQDALPPLDGQGTNAFPGSDDGFLPDDISGGQDGPVRQGGNADIWTQIQSQEQTESIRNALETIQGAQQSFSASLSGAGIQMMN